ncbi:MAG: SH3 domain-containing protein [Clostridiaceae bacterium]|nr:SH3 domain-containing protein [Clostridiaceae bacterium]
MKFGSVNRGGSSFATVNLQDTNSYLNVRDEPSMNGNIIDRLSHGQQVTVRVNRSIPTDWSEISY